MLLIGVSGCGTVNLALYQNEFDTRTTTDTQTTLGGNRAESARPPYIHLSERDDDPDPIADLIRKNP
jgi:hypothetical protein